jgi:hypothetical protein
VFAALSSFRGQGTLTKICKNDLAYTFVKPRLCSSRDILTDPVQPASSPCDALSFGLGFTADPALLGGVLPAAMPVPVCDPGQDPIDDTCN